MIISAIEANLETFRPSERQVAAYVLGRPSVVVNMSIADLAEHSQVSEPTIMRFCKAIGCLGFMELKLGLARDLERRTFMMNRTNAAIKGPSGFGQAIYRRILEDLSEGGELLALDQLDDLLEWCAASRTIKILHSGQEHGYAQSIEAAFHACQISAEIQVRVPEAQISAGHIVMCLRSAAHLTGLEAHTRDIARQGGKVVAVGFALQGATLVIGNSAALGSQPVRSDLNYLMTLESLLRGIEARLLRTGSFADTAQEYLQSDRESAYSHARRRDRKTAQSRLLSKEQA